MRGCVLWEDQYRLISWWEMAQFQNESVHSAIRILEMMRCDMMHYAKGDAPFTLGTVRLSGAEREKLEPELRFVEQTMKSIGLKTSAGAIFEFRNFLIAWKIQGMNLSPAEAATRIQVIQDTIRLEMSTHIFLYVPANRSDFYESYQQSLAHSDDIDAVRFGPEVESHFRSAQDDIRRAGNCLAVGEPTACVFHLMRVIERGLRALGAALNDPDLDPKRNPTWERILRKCDDELKKPLAERSPEWRKDSQFFSEATANIRSVKDAWRNETVHVEKDYDDEKAIAVFRVVRAFMIHLATKLHE